MPLSELMTEGQCWRLAKSPGAEVNQTRNTNTVCVKKSNRDLLLVSTGLITNESWIGLNDLSTTNAYVWSDDPGTVLASGDISWGGSQPNGGNEHCAMMKRDGLWYDRPCGSLLPSVCKKMLLCRP